MGLGQRAASVTSLIRDRQQTSSPHPGMPGNQSGVPARRLGRPMPPNEPLDAGLPAARPAHGDGRHRRSRNAACPAQEAGMTISGPRSSTSAAQPGAT
jgi:hypothetical protein